MSLYIFKTENGYTIETDAPTKKEATVKALKIARLNGEEKVNEWKPAKSEN